MSLRDAWNPRFVWFCRSKGIHNPADFIHESNRMLEFVEWNTGKIKEFFNVDPNAFYMGIYANKLRDFAAYDKWLESQYGVIE